MMTRRDDDQEGENRPRPNPSHLLLSYMFQVVAKLVTNWRDKEIDAPHTYVVQYSRQLVRTWSVRIT
jgi:hypothetical protein